MIKNDAFIFRYYEFDINCWLYLEERKAKLYGFLTFVLLLIIFGFLFE